MARDHGRILTSIWNDEDFVTRTAGAQRMYLLLLSQQNLSHAGLLPLTVKRWKRMAPNTTADQVDQWLSELKDSRFVVIDEDTEELLIRSLIRADGVWRQPNVLFAAAKDAVAIASMRLRAVLVDEVERMLSLCDLPDRSRSILGTLREALPNPTRTLREPLGKGSPNPTRTLREPLGKGSANPQGKGKGKGSSKVSVRTSQGTSEVGAEAPRDDVEPARQDVDTLCQRLADRMLANGCKPPRITDRWRKSAQLLLDNDRRPLDEALDLLDWCQADEFWQANIQSLPKFRERYDQLRLQRSSKRSRKVSGDTVEVAYRGWDV